MQLDAGTDPVFSELFGFLERAQYSWVPQTLENLLKLRKNPVMFGKLEQYFGLGLEMEHQDLAQVGMRRTLFEKISSLHIAVSSFAGRYVPHHHWGDWSHHHEKYIYLGQETFALAGKIKPSLGRLAGKSILDLGSGSGVLSIWLSPVASSLLGFELSAEAVRWARATADIYQIRNVSFQAVPIGTTAADQGAASHAWDCVVFNPPMAVPRPGSPQPHRDGGELGIEIPLLFLDFSFRHLKPQGEVFCLATNPIIRGRSVLLNRIDREKWRIREISLLHPRFNQSLYRKENYAALGIERVELLFLNLVKTGS